MSTARNNAAGAYDPLLGFVISGGPWGGTSVERTYDGVNFSTLPDMPRAFYLGTHCLVSLKNGVLFATGLLDEGTYPYPQGTYMYHGSNDSWSAMNNIPEGGHGKIFFCIPQKIVSILYDVLNVFIGIFDCSCGTIEEDGQVTEVIAAGGLSTKSVFIYNIESGLWRSGMVYLETHLSVSPI